MAGNKRGSWSAPENDVIRRLYGTTPLPRLARRLCRNEQAIRDRAVQLFAQPLRRGRWQQEELDRLREMIGLAGPEEMALVLGRSRRAVDRVLAELRGIRKRGSWSAREKHLLQRMYGTRADEALALALGRSQLAVKRMASQLALKKDREFGRSEGAPPRKMPRWTEEEVARLRSCYPSLSNLEVARRLGRSLRSVVSKASLLGLKKNPTLRSRAGRTNVSRRRDRS